MGVVWTFFFSHLFFYYSFSLSVGDGPIWTEIQSQRAVKPKTTNQQLCKLLEHIVCSNIMAHLNEHKLLSDRQHAFRKKHSCETQLITIINDWARILDKVGRLTLSFLDFEKAFDTPPHELLKCFVVWHWWEDSEMDRFFSL